MPATSEKQRKFFELVRAVQKGERSPDTVSSHVRKVAKSISQQDASDFAKGVAEESSKRKVLAFLKEIKNPQSLNEEEVNPISKQFTVKDDYEKYIKRYIGQPFANKELEAINNFKEQKPNKLTRIDVRYETADEFNNNTTTVIKKMRDSGEFSFNAFTKHKKSQTDDETDIPVSDDEQNDEQNNDQEDIIVTKSTLFKDEIEGGNILSEFLKKLDL